MWQRNSLLNSVTHIVFSYLIFFLRIAFIVKEFYFSSLKLAYAFDQAGSEF